MRRESANSLIDEIFAELILSPPHPARSYGPGMRKTRTNTGEPLPIALGIGHTKNPGDFRLAVRIQDSDPTRYAQIIEKINERAKGETDIEMVEDASVRHSAANPSQMAQKFRPLLLGSSVSIDEENAITGSIGLFPFSKAWNQRVLLSCAHVLDRVPSSSRRNIVQPGMVDNPGPGDVVGRLISSAPIKFDGTVNGIDAAIAGVELPPNTLVNSVLDYRTNKSYLITDVALPPVPTPGCPSGPLVHKLGRSTGFTSGRVRADSIRRTKIDYGGKHAIFSGFVEIVNEAPRFPFSDRGDSGSIVFDDTGTACGLVFSGGSHFMFGKRIRADITYASPLRDIFDHFYLTL